MTDDIDRLLERLKTFALRGETFDSLVVTVPLQDCQNIIATIERQRAELARARANAECCRSESVRLRNFEIMLMRLLRKPDNEDLQAKARDLLQRLGTKNGILRETDPC